MSTFKDLLQRLRERTNEWLQEPARGCTVSDKGLPPAPASLQGTLDPAELIEPAVRHYESCTLVKRKDPVGNWEIGWGRRCRADQQPITQETADTWLKEDIMQAMLYTDAWIDIEINPYQLAATTSLVYNLGIDKLKKSKCLKHINNGAFSTAMTEWNWWYGTDEKTGQKILLPGLVRRRIFEQMLFMHNPSVPVDIEFMIAHAEIEGDSIYEREMARAKIT